MGYAVPVPGPADAFGFTPADAVAPLEVLIVDDTERNLTAFEAMLAGLDARVVTASSGSEALKCLLKQDFALVLLDVRMPSMDGFETAELIRSRERSRHTPIIFLTAYDRSREQEIRGYALGAVDFLSKPVVPEVLRAKVAVLIELHRKTEEIRRQGELLQQAERREHAQRLEDERRRWDQDALRKEMERERRVAEQLHRSNARLRLLSEVASDLLLRDELSSFPARLFPLVREHLGIEACLYHRAAGPGEPLVLEALAGLEARHVEGIARVAPGELAFGRAAASGHVTVVEDNVTADAPADRFLRAAGLAACACFPLVAGGRLHGTLTFGTTRRSGFEPEELAVMGLVCDQVATALERARLVHELRRSAAELREADARKDQFLAMLGHELRNPLAPVLNAVKLMQQQSVAPPLQRILSSADRQIAHMTRLLDDLLDVSRIGNGKIELKRRIVDLRDVARDALLAIEALLTSRSQHLEVSLWEEPLPVDGDPVRLAQVLENLLQNAGKYTDPGGHIRLAGRCEQAEIVVTVEDDGIGIAPEMLPRIFDMFVQADQASDRALGGLWLGLTLVRSLVELHGGSVSAASEGPGRGSTFVVRLPAAAGALESHPVPRARDGVPANREEAAPRPPLDVVVVEDNSDIRESLKALLELRGCTVREAEDGRTGLDLIRARPPAVALVDIGLPGLDGYGLARELRATPNQTCLVAMTGYGRPEDRRLALDAGFDAHLVKPVDFDDLSRLLDELS